MPIDEIARRAARKSAACRWSDRRPGRTSHARPRPSSPPVNAMNSDSARTSVRIAGAREPQRLQHRELARALAHRLRHRAGGDEAEHEQHGRRDRDHDAADVADLLREPLDESLFGRRLRLGRRVGEHLVERAAQIDGLRRIGNLDDVPADLPLALGPILVEVVVPEEHLRLVDGVAAVVDADDVEFPRGAAALRQPDRRGQRNSVADLPAEPLRRDRGRRWRPADRCATLRPARAAATNSG